MNHTMIFTHLQGKLGHDRFVAGIPQCLATCVLISAAACTILDMHSCFNHIISIHESNRAHWPLEIQSGKLSTLLWLSPLHKIQNKGSYLQDVCEEFLVSASSGYSLSIKSLHKVSQPEACNQREAVQANRAQS